MLYTIEKRIHTLEEELSKLKKEKALLNTPIEVKDKYINKLLRVEYEFEIHYLYCTNAILEFDKTLSLYGKTVCFSKTLGSLIFSQEQMWNCNSCDSMIKEVTIKDITDEIVNNVKDNIANLSNYGI